MKRLLIALAAALVLSAASSPPDARAEDIGCIDTAFQLLGPNHAVCVSAFDDPKIPGVTCHISQARKGGLKGMVGLAEDLSEFSIACRQVGPITLPDEKTLSKEEDVFSERTSVFFKKTRVIRLFDKKRNSLVYVALSTRLIDGSPKNAISTVPVQKWQ